MEKLLIVDGSNLLFQMFYGMPARIVNKEGKAIHGTLGFIGALLKIVRRVRPTHLIVLFDGECRNERKDIDADYKANRPDFSQMAEEETPFSQLPDIYAALDHLHIVRAETTTCETDDLVASYALGYGKKMQVTISSFDSDFFQLINENVSVLRYRGDNTVVCDPAYVEEKFGVPPSRYADLKALTGDNADNIKGAYKIGPKTAAKLLLRFGDLESLLQNADEIKQDGVRKSIKEATERLRKNQRLIKLDGHADIPFELDRLRFTYDGATTNDVLTAIGLK